MKKSISILLAAILTAASMAGCSSNDTSSEASTTTEAATTTASTTEALTSEASPEGLTEENGVLTGLDTENCPFEGAGLRITIDTAAKTAEFFKTDLNGNDTVEYYIFDYSGEPSVEQYYYVSMMGTGFYYTYDLSAGEIVKIEDSDHADVTQSTKDSGRFDSANDRLKGDVAAIENYFLTQYGKTISDAVAGE
ncbi:MAG: hypothetical protein WC900_08835 [Oscillospiraceae bacterium]